MIDKRPCTNLVCSCHTWHTYCNSLGDIFHVCLQLYPNVIKFSDCQSWLILYEISSEFVAPLKRSSFAENGDFVTLH